MKKLRKFPVYWLVVPLFLVIGLIYGGVIQRVLPAVTVHGNTYTAAAFNYYFYTEYLNFTDSHYDELDALGLEPGRDLSQQSCEGYGTWEDYFRQAALDRISEVEFLLSQAEEDGYAFSDADLGAYQEELDRIDAYLAEAGETLQQYIQAYYGASMTEKIFLKELKKCSQAESYRAVLMERLTPEAEVLEGYLQENPPLPEEDYALVSLYQAWFHGATDRFTGEFTDAQYQDLSVKADTFLVRWQAAGGGEEQFRTLAEKWSEDSQVLLTDVDKGTLPQEAEDWCYAGDRQPGDTTVCISQDGLWILCWLSAGESAWRVHTAQALAQESYQGLRADRQAEFAPQQRFGMQFAM